MDLQKIKTLLDFVSSSRVAELTVSQDGTTVIIRNAVSGGGAVEPSDEDDRDFDQAEISGHVSGKTVCSPVSGVVHRSNSPGAAPLVKPGDRVEAGQGVCIVEAMKVFTTVPASVEGKVLRVLFEDGQEVAAGQPLVEIE